MIHFEPNKIIIEIDSDNPQEEYSDIMEELLTIVYNADDYCKANVLSLILAMLPKKEILTNCAV